MSSIVQQTIRIPQQRNEHIKAVAEQSGTSYNSLINYLIFIGLKVIEAQIHVSLEGITHD